MSSTGNTLPNKVPQSEWSATNAAALGAAATCTKTAPGANLRIVVTWLSITMLQSTAGTAANNGVALTGSSSGALQNWTLASSQTTSQPLPTIFEAADPLFVCAENESLTLAFPSGTAGWYESVSMGGYLTADY